MKRSCSPFWMVALLALQGCYIYAPVQSPVPPTGQSVVLNISDRGRVALGERLGPGVTRIQGRVTSVEDESVSMSVAAVGYISGERSLWSGESVSLSRDFVNTVEVRQLSKSRTWMLVGATTVVVGTFIATHGLTAFFNDLPNDDGGPDGGPISFRLRVGLPF
jgi:hypothetical protein